MENNQNPGNQAHANTQAANQQNQPIPPVVPAPPAPRSSEDFRRQWREHRSHRMAIGLIVAILVAIVIFAAGFMVGRLSGHHPAYGAMRTGGYTEHMRSSTGSGMNRMRMHGGNSSQGTGTSGMAVPATPAVPSTTPPSSTTAPANQ